MKRRTWDVVELGIVPNDSIELCCPHCGNDASMPIIATPSNHIIAAIGLTVIFDKPWLTPKSQFMPTQIRCRSCRRHFKYIN